MTTPINFSALEAAKRSFENAIASDPDLSAAGKLEAILAGFQAALPAAGSLAAKDGEIASLRAEVVTLKARLAEAEQVIEPFAEAGHVLL